MEQQQTDVKEVSAGKGTPATNAPAPKKSRKKMSKGKIVGIVIVVLVIWFGAVQFMAAERYQMQVQVVEPLEGEKSLMGVNPTGESLDFGDLSHNLGATRYVTLKNVSNRDRYILIWKRGGISDMVKLNQNNFVLKTGEEVKLEFTISIPPSAEIDKYYKGKVMIFRWPKLF